MRFLFLFLALIGGGCALLRDSGEGQKINIFPDSWPVKTGESSLVSSKEDLRAPCGMNQTDAAQFLHAMGIPDAQIQAELADPFVSLRLPYIMFETVKTPPEISKFYYSQFEKTGWRKKREILAIEYTNGGGDWCEVYQKNNMEVLLHVIGHKGNKLTATEQNQYIGRIIVFKFFQVYGIC